MSSRKQELAWNVFRYNASGKATAITYRLSSNVLFVRFYGRDIGEVFDGVFSDIIATHEAHKAPVDFFIDLRSITSFAGSARERGATFARENRHRVRIARVLVSNPLVEMAVSIVGMVMGGGILQSVRDESAFVAMLRESLPSTTTLPPVSIAHTQIDS